MSQDVDILTSALSVIETGRNPLGSRMSPGQMREHASYALKQYRSALSPPPVPDGAALKALERNYGPLYYIEKSAKLLLDIDKNRGLKEGGEQYPNGLCCLDYAERLKSAAKEIRAHLTTAPVQSVTVEELTDILWARIDKNLTAKDADLKLLGQELLDRFPHGLRIIPQPPKEGE